MTLLTTSYSRGPFFGGTGNRTGSAGSRAGCDGPICHASNGGSSSLSISLLQNGVPVSSYIPGAFYQIRLTLPVSVPYLRNFGFQASVVKAADGVTQAGFLTTGGRSDISVYQDVLVQLVEHNRYIAGTAIPPGGTFLDTVSFGWQAPAAGFGSVRVYAVVNAVDSSGSPSGDQPRAGFQDFREQNANGVAGAPALKPPLLVPNTLSTATEALELRGLTPGERLNLAIVDMQGRVIQQKNDLQATDGSIHLRIAPLPAGRFLLVTARQSQLRALPFQVK